MTIEERAAQTAEWKATGQYSGTQGVPRPAFLIKNDNTTESWKDCMRFYQSIILLWILALFDWQC